MKKTLTFIFALLIAHAIFAQPSIQEENPPSGSGINRNVPVTISFKVYGVAYLNDIPFTLGYAQNVSPTISITGSSPANPTPSCGGGSCSFTFTPTTNSNSVTVTINGTADMEYASGSQHSADALATRVMTYTVTGPLSVEMLSFEATSPKVGLVNLVWKTASEKDNAHFDVERSLNGKDFQKIGTIEGAGTSDQANVYGFTDSQKPEGKIAYYRLNIVDINGEGYFSKTVVAYDKKGKLDIKSANENFVNLEAASTGDIELSLININGQSVLTKKLEVSEGYNSLEINTSALSSGMYILHVTDGREQKTVKIFKN